MKLRDLLLFGTLLTVPAMVVAQQASVPSSTASQAPQEDEGLTGSVTDESEWQDLGIAIPAFPTNASVATAATGGNTEALGRNVARYAMERFAPPL